MNSNTTDDTEIAVDTLEGRSEGGIEPIDIQEEMEKSFLDYSMSVIVSRALPDVRDGLKPVHRRILFSMFSQGLRPDRPYTKCARVVGDVMGTYHPHGDSAIYDALARMVQDFSLRYPLIDGHGNFGGTGPDEGPAAMRYTESRLHALALELLADIDEDTVDFVPNYDATSQEPVVMPSRFPNLLANGSQGIAVGMATNIPPHNLGEIIDATIAVLKNPQSTSEELMAFVKGPDFPTGALILGRSGIRDAYRTGKGSIKIRAKAEIEVVRSTERIVVSEMPYQTSVESVEKKMADLIKSGELDGIARWQNASAGKQSRLIIELRRDANSSVVLNNLFKHTPMQVSFGINMVALVDGVPRTLDLAHMLLYYAQHQTEVMERRSRFRLGKARDREHIVEGLVRALDMLDEVVSTIRNSEDRAAARGALMADPFAFTEIQANHILDMTLSRLTRLGRTELDEELAKLRETIAYLEALLSDPIKLRDEIISDLIAIKERFGDARRTRIVNDPGDLAVEDLIEDEDLVITLTQAGYIKAMPASTFKSQARGGKGVMGTRLKEEDIITSLVHTSSHSYLLLFTNMGRVYRLRGHEIPVKERTARGTAIVNVVSMDPGEKVAEMLSAREQGGEGHLLFVTKHGLVKKTRLEEYDKSRREGIIAINLRPGDELVKVMATSGNDEILIFSRSGKSIRISEQGVRPMGRSASGVIGMRLHPGDAVVGSDIVHDGCDVLLVTDGGYGKRTSVDHFNVQVRGGQGVRAIRTTASRGNLAGAFLVSADDEIIVVSSGGTVIRLSVVDVARQGRDATGVRIMNLGADQTVAAIAVVAGEDEHD
ncbi:MAG: DNA gyrase subunit A [Actinobacteria bacterium]|nr:DNA gyrase subunit A [Actinomycetota bacterium]